MVMRYEKDGGTVFDVRQGQTWKADSHQMTCADILAVDDDDIADLTGLSDRPMLYCDPPWNAGNARSFRTKAGVDGKQGQAVDFMAIYRRVIVLMNRCALGGVIEAGIRQAPGIAEEIRTISGRLASLVPGTYYRRAPMMYLVATVRAEEVAAVLSGMDDEDAPRAVIRLLRPTVVVDPCFGRGLTAVSCAAEGVTFRGMELNPYRVSVTLRKLRDMGYSPRPVVGTPRG